MESVENMDVAAAPQSYRQPLRPLITTSIESRNAAREIADASGRRIDTPVRKSFVRSIAGSGRPAPLAQIYSGGRSGTVAVKLYLGLLWRSAKPPFSSDRPARAWATLLDLPDPRGKGTRRVVHALKTLETLGLVDVQAQPGYPNLVTLREESGTGAVYGIPSSSYSFARAKGAPSTVLELHTYFKIAQRLWTEGHIASLDGPGLVMLLILLAEQGGEGKKVWFSTEEFPKRYNISHKTRAAGTKELVKAGLLTIGRESLSSDPRSTKIFDAQRMRNVYRLAAIAQS